MKIGVYTLTRDRLDYTKGAFASLQRKAGVPYLHYVVDNGSQDGTPEWLKEYDKQSKHTVTLSPKKENVGISKASNEAVRYLLDAGCELIVKMDNDCEVVSDNILGQMVEITESLPLFSPAYVLSPRVEGINTQPTRHAFTQLGGRKVGLTTIVGGLFHVVAAPVYRAYMEAGGFPENLPRARGQDDHFCEWVRRNGGQLGYVEGLVVNHKDTTDGQAQRYPDYFKRKWAEEKS